MAGPIGIVPLETHVIRDLPLPVTVVTKLAAVDPIYAEDFNSSFILVQTIPVIYDSQAMVRHTHGRPNEVRCS
jgi:hypothetical protein